MVARFSTGPFVFLHISDPVDQGGPTGQFTDLQVELAVRDRGLWDSRSRVDADLFPTMGQMLHDHARPSELTRQELSEVADRDLHDNMY